MLDTKICPPPDDDNWTLVLPYLRRRSRRPRL